MQPSQLDPIKLNIMIFGLGTCKISKERFKKGELQFHQGCQSSQLFPAQQPIFFIQNKIQIHYSLHDALCLVLSSSLQWRNLPIVEAVLEAGARHVRTAAVAARCPAVVGTSLGQGPDQLLVVSWPPAQPANLGLWAAGEHGPVARVAPHDGGDAALGAELRHLFQHRVWYRGRDEDFLGVGRTKSVVLVGHGDSPSALEVKPQPGEFTSEPCEICIQVSIRDPGTEFFENIFTRPGEVTKRKNILDLLWRGKFVENTPGPLLRDCSVVKLNPEGATIFAVNLETE